MSARGIDLSRHPWVVVLSDCLIGIICYFLAYYFREILPVPFTHELLPSERFFQVRHYWWLLILLQPTLLFIFDAYHEIRFKGVREFAISVSMANGAQAMILIAVYFFTANLTYPRTIFPIYWLLDSFALILWRALLRRAATRIKRRALIVGDGSLAEQLTAELSRSPESGFQVVGVVSDNLAKGAAMGPYPVLGGREEIAQLIRAYDVEEVVLTPESSWKDRLVDSISRLEATSVRVTIVPSVYEILIGRIRHFKIRDIPLIEVVGNPNDPLSSFMRRSRDLLFGIILVVLLFPLWLVVALAIKLFDGGKALYVQDRIGERGRLFRLFKFRTMPEGAEDETGPILSWKDDPRVTSLGRVLRRLRIDETLQLVNVLKGDMSLVGPRPERPDFVARFEREIPGYSERNKVKPGITGLAQIRGYYHSDPSIKLKYDLAYVHNRSLFLDIIILIETIRVALRREGI